MELQSSSANDTILKIDKDEGNLFLERLRICTISGRITLKDTEELDIERIMEEYGSMVYRIAMVHSATKEDAEDIFQEVFLRLVRYREHLNSEEYIKNWLIRVTVNCGNTYRRKWGKGQTLPLEEGILVENGDNSSEIEQKVFVAVKGLPEKYRAVIHLYYYEELSVKEISETLERREGTVKSQIARGREILSKKLGKEFGDGATL